MKFTVQPKVTSIFPWRREESEPKEYEFNNSPSAERALQIISLDNGNYVYISGHEHELTIAVRSKSGERIGPFRELRPNCEGGDSCLTIRDMGFSTGSAVEICIPGKERG